MPRIFIGFSSLKIVTKSTHSRAARASALSFSLFNGLLGPLSFFAEESEFTATIRILPSFFASCKYLIWPMCRMSKMPLVVTIFLPTFFSFSAIFFNSLIFTIFFGIWVYYYLFFVYFLIVGKDTLTD